MGGGQRAGSCVWRSSAQVRANYGQRSTVSRHAGLARQGTSLVPWRYDAADGGASFGVAPLAARDVRWASARGIETCHCCAETAQI